MKWGIRKQEGGGTAKTGSSSDKTTGYEPKSPGTRAGQTRREKRKALNKPNYRYKARARAEDKQLYGKRAVKRINKKLNTGSSLKDARKSETKRYLVKTAAGAAATLATFTYAQEIGNTTIKALKGLDKAAGDAARNHRMKAGRKAANNLFADSKGIANYRTIPMNYNPLKDIWE